MVVELSDVWLCACPRTEEEWEEDLAGQRAKVCLPQSHTSPAAYNDTVHAGIDETMYLLTHDSLLHMPGLQAHM